MSGFGREGEAGDGRFGMEDGGEPRPTSSGSGMPPHEQMAWLQAELARQTQGMANHIRASIMAEMAAAPAAATASYGPRGPGLHPAKPAKFRGDRGDAQEVTVWLFSLTTYFRASHVAAEAEQLAFAPAMLEGPALAWWMSNVRAAENGSGPSAPTTWHEFATALTQRFQPINAERVSRDRLLSLRQLNSVSSYASAFQQLILYCPDISPQEQLHRFVHGLKPHVQRELLLREPADISTAISMAERVDTITYRPPHRPNYSGHSNGGYGATPMELGALEGDGEGQGREDEEGDLEGQDEARRHPAPATFSRGQLEQLVPELVQQLAALQQQSRGGGEGRGSNGQFWPRPKAQTAGTWRQPGRAEDGPKSQLSPQQAAARKEECFSQRLCFNCMRPGHREAECRAPWRPKASAPPA